jgi:hypothetical protein
MIANDKNGLYKIALAPTGHNVYNPRRKAGGNDIPEHFSPARAKQHE